MENYGKENGKDEASVQWHTLSENLMDLGSENREPPQEEADSPLPQGNIPMQAEKTIVNSFAPPEQQKPEEIKKTQSGKKKKPILAIVAAVFALLLVSGAALFYFTVHRWTEPTCTEASVCTICGKQGSPAAGHQWTEPSCTEASVCAICGKQGSPATGHEWIPATCTAARTCSVCRETEGNPLKHNLKDAASYNYIECTKESWKECSWCDYRTSIQSKMLTSFLDDTKEFFRMSPNEFKERVEYLASQFDPTKCSLYELTSLDDLKNVTFRWDDSSGSQDSSALGLPVLNCYAGSEFVAAVALVDLNDKDETEEVDRDRPSSFNIVGMSGTFLTQKAKSVYYSMELILVAACDPEVNIYDYTTFGLAAQANSVGWTEHNDLIYGVSDSNYTIATRKMVDKLSNMDS